jgi:sugar lactone lactonase YvrE
MTYEARVASSQAYLLAEGPVWDEARARLLWVDILAGQVVEARLSDDAIEVVRTHALTSESVSAVVPGRDGGLLVAAHDRFAVVTPDGEIAFGPRILPVGAKSRLNDGACDPSGRFLVGSMALDGRAGDERLYRLDRGSVTVVADGLTLSNGLGWSPDGRTMYHVDSIPGVVWAQPYDPASGDFGSRQEVLRVVDGTPDGLCVDVEGNLWIAIWGKGQVRCFTPEGLLLATVLVPAPHTSSVAFVGPGRDVLLITTARAELGADDQAAFPDSGRLFLATVDAVGLPSATWDGVSGVVSPSLHLDD